MPSHAAFAESPDAPNSSPGSSRLPSATSTLRALALLAFVALMVWLPFNVVPPELAELRSWIESYGWWGRLVFVAIYAVVGITPIPVTIMAVAGGLLFGVIEGTVLSVIGSMLGSAAAYWIARGLGRDIVMSLLGSRGRTIENHLESAGFSTVFMLRVMPGMPYWPVNYGAGALGVASQTYLSASLLATVPGQTSLVAIGALIADRTLLTAVILGISWLVVVGLTVWAWREWKSQTVDGEDEG